MADAEKVLDDVKGVGASTRTAILDRYPTLSALSLATAEDLTEIRGVGPATADAIRSAVGEALESEATADVADPDELTPASAVAVETAVADGSRSEEPADARQPGDSTTDPAAALPRAEGSTADGASGGERERGVSAPPLERVRRDLDETLGSFRDALLAVGGVVIAAVAAGRDQLPRVTENLREAGSSASRTATDLLAALRGARGDRS